MEFAKNYQFLSLDSLDRLWQNIQEYYSSNTNPIHIGNNTTALTRDISLEGTDNLATTKYVKDLVLDTLEGGLSAIPVKDVQVNGVSVLENQIANISTLSAILVENSEVPIVNNTALISLPLTDVQVDGESIVNDKVASITLPESHVKIFDLKENLPAIGSKDYIYVTLDDSKIRVWNEGSYQEVSSIDAQLRILLDNHLLDKSNPHDVTKDQIGLGNVDNTSDLDKPLSSATSDALNNLKVSILEISESLKEKLSESDCVSNLKSTESTKPLSANQGKVLNEKINSLNSSISGIGHALHFKGVVSSVSDLKNIEDPESGDTYQIQIFKEDGSLDNDLSGAMYAWNGSEWVQIASTAADVTAQIASLDEVYDLITSYGVN